MYPNWVVMSTHYEVYSTVPPVYDVYCMLANSNSRLLIAFNNATVESLVCTEKIAHRPDCLANTFFCLLL